MERKVTPKKLPTQKKKQSLENFPLVEVIWVDAEEHGDVGWNCLEEMKNAAKTEPKEMRTVGYVLHRGEKHISLVGTVGPEECSSLSKIPTEFVREIRELN
jgi:hypothetical protein|tara:strand:+ start:1266 stop:1568 length:303 start_codon:yes stop_codon:yes gene_type:complete